MRFAPSVILAVATALSSAVTAAVVVTPSSNSQEQPSIPELPKIIEPTGDAPIIQNNEKDVIVGKRDANADPDALRRVIFNKDYLAAQNTDSTSSSTTVQLDPWLRTIYGTVKEIVTPTVIGGITFKAKPTATETNGFEPWVSLKKDGSPKTIKPKEKKGGIADGLPDYKTYFKTATTIVHDQKDLNAHNLKEGETFEEVIWTDEDKTYVQLSPLMRCTPDFYFKKGVAGTLMSDPFCSPRENSNIKLDGVHFLTWYTRFFKDARKVRVHYAYVKENLHEKGFAKRDTDEIPGDVKEITSSVEGAVFGAFYSSDWFYNTEGYFPLQFQEEWLKGDVSQRVMVVVQPDTEDTEDYDLSKASASLVVKFMRKAIVAKNTKEKKLLDDQTSTGDDVYYIIMAIPTCVILAVLGMYIFLFVNRKHRDLSHLRKPKRSRFGNYGKYDLPFAQADIHKPKSGKQF